jgi:hypothetical protein
VFEPVRNNVAPSVPCGSSLSYVNLCEKLSLLSDLLLLLLLLLLYHFMQCIYNYITAINHVSRVYTHIYIYTCVCMYIYSLVTQCVFIDRTYYAV